MEVIGVHQLLGYQYSSKHLILGSMDEGNSCRFWTTWGWVSDDIIFHLFNLFNTQWIHAYIQLNLGHEVVCNAHTGAVIEWSLHKRETNKLRPSKKKTCSSLQAKSCISSPPSALQTHSCDFPALSSLSSFSFCSWFWLWHFLPTTRWSVMSVRWRVFGINHCTFKGGVTH